MLIDIWGKQVVPSLYPGHFFVSWSGAEKQQIRVYVGHSPDAFGEVERPLAGCYAQIVRLFNYQQYITNGTPKLT